MKARSSQGSHFVVFLYDANGNKYFEMDERGGVMYWVYDQADRVRMAMDQGDATNVRGKTYFGWDAVGLMRMKTDADGRLTSFGYFGFDASRRTTTMTFTSDPSIYYTYDSLGNLIQMSDETGTFAQAFDRLDRITVKQTKAGTVYYAFDRAGLKQSLKDTDFTESYYGYDAASRLAYVMLLDSPQRGAYYAYDASGLLTKKSLPAARVLSYYAYDGAGRLSQLENKSDGSTLITYFAYNRDANGQLTRILREGGRNDYYAFDALDRLTQEESYDGAGGFRYGYKYNYDANSNRYFKHDSKRVASSYYAYDARNFMRKEEQR